MKTTPLLAVFLALSLGACGNPVDGDVPAVGGPSVPPPVPPGAAASEVAAGVELPAAEPDHDDDQLHNLFRLSDNIISGAEPDGEEALRRLAGMGVKTILSVDGKEPEAEAAARLGMRYVHVPIQYRGITEDELLGIAKTFRELEPPFYVHCFHGRHRGPAAAAVGRVVLDGVPRERAIAEMRQWMGTSTKYEGLYETIARKHLPTPEETATSAFAFPASHSAQGIAQAMIEIARGYDNLKGAVKRDWKPDPNHPDLNELNESEKLAQLFETTLSVDGTDGRPDDFLAWLGESRDAGAVLSDVLRDFDRDDPAQREAATAAFQSLAARCDSCHVAYRN